MKVRAIRGATTSDNTPESIRETVTELIFAMIKGNNVPREDICFVNFSTTKDIDVDYPAKYARMECGFESVPMTCFQEMDVQGSLRKCIRVMMVVNADKEQHEIRHQYLRGTDILRPDLLGKTK